MKSDRPLRRGSCFRRRGLPLRRRYCTAAGEVLGGYDPAAMFAVGTDADFCELNVNRPSPGVANWICYSINPETHADDNDSIMETLEAQPQTVESARQVAGSSPIAVSAVTLKPRFNPYAIVAEALPEPGELPRQVDLRQASLFAAAWTLGSIAQLARAGAHSITYYETTGWRGIMPSSAERPPALDWPRERGSVYPVYHVLADVRELAAGRFLAVDSSQPQKVLGLASLGATASGCCWRISPASYRRSGCLRKSTPGRGAACGFSTSAREPKPWLLPVASEPISQSIPAGRTSFWAHTPLSHSTASRSESRATSPQHLLQVGPTRPAADHRGRRFR